MTARLHGPLSAEKSFGEEGVCQPYTDRAFTREASSAIQTAKLALSHRLIQRPEPTGRQEGSPTLFPARIIVPSTYNTSDLAALPVASVNHIEDRASSS